jgi:maltooligosyltrehalose trehalohydrolase
MGDRLHHVIDREAYLAASALLCLTPYTPMLFMGQEWAASTPFIFFTDHNEDLGKLVTAGRHDEFKGFAAFRSEAARDKIPDPQSPKSFTDSKLVWDELRDEKKSQTLELYRKCLHLRQQEAVFRPASRQTWYVTALEMGAGALRYKGPEADWLILFDLEGGHSGPISDEWICKPRTEAGWTVVLSTNEKQFGGTGSCAYEAANGQARFGLPELVVLRS